MVVERRKRSEAAKETTAGFDSVDRSVAYILSSPADLTLRVGVHVSARRVGIVQGCKTGKYQVLILERVGVRIRASRLASGVTTGWKSLITRPAEVVESTVSVVNSIAVVRENEVVVVNENVVGAAQSPGQMTVSVVERIGN